MGPIAKVMAKKTAARTTDRDAYFVLLADAVTDGAARQKLLDGVEAAGVKLAPAEPV